MFTHSVIGAGVIAAAMLCGAAATAAADPPNCTAADLAGVMSGVSAGTSAYLFTHPEVNAFFHRPQWQAEGPDVDGDPGLQGREPPGACRTQGGPTSSR